MRYRRSQTPGASYFFTLITYQRKKLFIDDKNIILLREAFRYVKSKHPFKIDAFVLLPEHLHCIWTLPEEDKDFPLRWRLIKSFFTKRCSSEYKNKITKSRKEKGEQCIWQRRYWEHQIKDEEDFIRHVEYIHYNPVKHGYVKSVKEWKYSSFHRYVRLGMYANNWCSNEKDLWDIGE